MTQQAVARTDERLNLVSSIPFVLVHLVALLAFYTGVTWQLALLCLVSYYVRIIGVTAGYHRYFSHRTFKTSRVFQFVLAFLAETSIQKGVLWWAAHHRHHHRESDQPEDIHSPTLRGLWWSHVGWILCDRYNETRFEAIRDFARYPELRFLNKHYYLPPLLLGIVLFAIGGLPTLIWGLFVPSVLVWHGTFTINSLSHVFGKRRYKTTDTSRNNWLLAIVTAGEGWHNNHHYHQNTANQGWFWWEVDLTFYVLKVLSWFGLVWDLRLPSDAVRYAHLKYTDQDRAQLRAESAPAPLGGKRAPARSPLPALPLAAAAPSPLLKRR